MIWRSPILRVSLGIAMLTLTLLFTGDVIFGLSTESLRPELDSRKHLAETLAVQYSDLAAREDYDAMESAMELLVERNPRVLSTAVRRADGKILASAGDHLFQWRGAPPAKSTVTHARVPIFKGGERWGTLEVRFTELAQGSLSGLLDTAWFRLLLFVGLAGSVAYFVYMRRTLRHLDPAAVIPARVRAAFDVLAEGVTFIDAEGRVVLANNTFTALVGSTAEQLMGRALDSIGFRRAALEDATGAASPWSVSLAEGEARTGVAMVFDTGGEIRTLTVNAAPVVDDKGRARGAIVTFDDVTELELKRQQLEEVVVDLRASRDEIRRQNEKLEFMATRDPLTNCLNRRAFVEVLEREVGHARRDGDPLSCIMLDIDHFKSVNDGFGHAAGDAAIRFVAGAVSEVTRGFDLVCRYGGEEFCVLLPAGDTAVGREVAERIREAVQEQSAAALPELKGRVLTVSLGVAALEPGDESPMAFVDRADGALYVSKNSGRDRTTVAAPAPAAPRASVA